MKRSLRLQPIVRLARMREDGAGRACGVRRNELADAERQLGELLAYRRQYLQRLDALGSGGVGAAELRALRRFIGALDEAIAQQRLRVEAACACLAGEERRWQELRARRKALDGVGERLSAEERRSEDREAQRESDEHAGRWHGDGS